MNNFLGMRIDPELKKELERLAEKEHRKLSNYCEIIFREHVSKIKSKDKKNVC